MYIGIEVVWCIIIELISMNSSSRYDVSQTHQATPAPKKTPKAVEQLQVGSAMEDFVAGLRKKQQEEIGKKASSNKGSDSEYSESVESESEATSKRPAAKTPAAAPNRKDRNKDTAWKRFQREGELDEDTLNAFLKANKAGQRDIVNEAVVKAADGSYQLNLQARALQLALTKIRTMKT